MWFRNIFRKRDAPSEPVVVNMSLVIRGVEVYVVDLVPTGKVQFCQIGHAWNPTSNHILVCDLDTYVSLAANSDSQRLVGMMVEDSIRALKVKKEAAERRERRRARRLAQRPSTDAHQ